VTGERRARTDIEEGGRVVRDKKEETSKREQRAKSERERERREIIEGGDSERRDGD
jgi:hypothetical protein